MSTTTTLTAAQSIPICVTVDDIRNRKPDNLGVYTNPEHELYMKASPRPKPGSGECLIHVRATGICGSVVHFWKKGHIGDMVVVGRNGLGHERSGVVIEVGDGVTSFKTGDRVTLECGVPCMEALCKMCKTGRYNACPEVVFFSTPPHHGTLKRYHLHPEEWLHKLHDSLSYEEGSLLEPLSVALAGIDRSGVRLGDPVIICGSGPIGLVTLLAANAAGANPIVITDLVAGRLETAKRLVPRVQTLQKSLSEIPRDVARRVKDALGGEARLVLDCTGVQSSVQTGIHCCEFGGAVLVTGCGKDFQEIPFQYLAAMEINLKFQYRYKNTYPKAISLVSSGMIDLKPLVTHILRLEEGEKAFQAASSPAAKAIKVQILND